MSDPLTRLEAQRYWSGRTNAELSLSGPSSSERGRSEHAHALRSAAVLLRITGGRELESFIVCFTAAAALLARYAQRSTFVAHGPATDDVPWGVPLILDVDPAATVRRLIAAADAAVLDAIAFASGARDAFRSSPRVSNIAIRSTSGHRAPDMSFDLTLLVDQTQIRAMFDAAVFPGWFVRELLENFDHVLGAFASADTRVAELSILAPSAIARLDRYARTRAPSPLSPERTLVSRWRAVVERTPDAPALRGEQIVTHRALWLRARGLARHLHGLGAGRGDRVAIFLDKSDVAMVAIWGALMSGAAYVPIASDQPLRRASRILADVGAKVLITESARLLDIPDFDGPIVAADVERFEDDGGPLPEIEPRDLAYVMYTSGSTGDPKGVRISHRAIGSYLDWKQRYFAIDPTFVMLQIPSLAFDTSVSDIFSVLIGGGSLVLVPDRDRLDPDRLVEALDRHAVTTMTLVPSLYRILLPMLGRFADRLQVVTVAGERMDRRVAEMHQRLLPSTRLVNEYGPTENAVGAAAYDYAAGLEDGEIVGWPLDNTAIDICDDQLRLLPAGVTGEIVLGGEGLADGYHGREDLTRAAFVETPRGRVYRTGDFGRWREDGCLEFRGRRDDQVKINGQRIELGEVEAALRSLPEVQDAAVAARGDPAALVAYIVGTASAPRLREALVERLPRAMIPTRWVYVDRFERTTSGKIERSRLPEPAADLERPPAPPPSDPVLARVLAIWSEELDAPNARPDDHFYALGGDSLRGIRIVQRLREAFDAEVMLWELFDDPSVHQVAELARRRRGSTLSAIPRAPDAPDYPLSDAQRRMWVLEHLHRSPLPAYHVPDAFEIRGELSREHVTRAIAGAIARHESLRARIVVKEGEPRQLFDNRPELAFVEVFDLEAFLVAEARARFDLERGVVRVRLAKLAERRHVLTVTSHHVAMDGWSAQLLIREIFEDLATIRAGGTPARSARAVRYRDYAAWQVWTERDRAYWLDRLCAPRAVLDLPKDRGRPAVQSFAGAHVRRALDLSDLAVRHGATPFAVLTTIVNILLYRYTREQDILVGVPALGRPHPELRELVGLFVNTLVLRSRVEDHDDFAALLGRVRQTIGEAYDHQAYPFDRLVSDLDCPRDMSRNPLVDVLVMVDDEVAIPAVDGLEIERCVLASPISKVDLTFALCPRGLSIEYASDLYTAPRIERMADHLLLLTEAIRRRPDLRIDELPMMDDAERSLVEGGFDGPRIEREEATLPGAFEIQAARTPGRTAFLEAEPVSYASVLAAARAHMSTLETGPGDIVAIVSRPSAETYARALAVMMTGAAYLPIAEHEPPERIRLFREDSGAVLFGEKGRGRARAPRPADPAYIIYTSGATGRPKGVAIPHRAVMNLVRWHQAAFSVSEASRATALASLGFDASVWEVWPYLLAGAAIRPVIEPARRDPKALVRELLEHGITHAFIPTGLVPFLADAELPPSFIMLTGGERLASAPRTRFRLYNNYGPSEATVVTTSMEVTGRSADVPIGRAIDNVNVRITDERGRPAPIGVAGEIRIGGLGLGSPIGQPLGFETVGGEAWYRSGDRGAFRADSTIDFLGRLDEQVSIRGYRVEPSEVEAVLSSLDGVEEAAVIAGGDVLRAFVRGRVPEPGELSSRLPAHMCPASIEALAALPRNSSGKVDRAELRARRGATPLERARPRYAIEEVLAGIWADVLGRSRVSVDDDVFALGATSLKAILVSARAEAALGLEVPLAAIYSARSVARLCEELDYGRRRPPILHRPRDVWPASPAQADILAVASRLPPDAFNVQLGRRLEGPIDVERLERALARVVQRHPILRARVRGGELVLDAPDVPLHLHRAGTVDLTSMSRARLGQRFDLEAGPLWSADLVELGAGASGLLLTAHHVIADGWSMELVLRDLLESYEGRALADPPIDYGDYAAWMNEQGFEESLACWAETLADLGPPLDLPRDRPRLARSSYLLEAIDRRLAPSLAERARRLLVNEGISTHALLLTALGRVLSAISGREEVRIGTLLFGRSREALHQLVGLFVNTAVIRVRPGGDAQASRARTQHALVRALQHQDAPFSRIRDRIEGEERGTLFEVLLVYQVLPGGGPAASRATPLEGLTTRQNAVTTCDLIVSVDEGFSVTVTYKSELFDRSRIEAVLDAFERELAEELS